MRESKPKWQLFVYYVCLKDIEEEPLEQLAHSFWKIEAEGTLLVQNENSSADKIAVHALENSFCHNGERDQIGLPWKAEKKLQNNYFSAVGQLKSLHNHLQNDPPPNQKYNKTL